MQVEIGKIYEGTVKNITNYGTFVDIHNPDGERIMGMVHISEISRSYVSEIRDFVTEGQQVKVKVIGINPQGKISLSMKQGGQRRGGKPSVWEPKKRQAPSEMTFEDMLSHFKQNSEEKMCDIKRNTERKNRSRRK